MSDKEATARIKINRLLKGAGWRFFAEGSAPANIRLEPGITIKTPDLYGLGQTSERTANETVPVDCARTNNGSLVGEETPYSNPNPDHASRNL
jgi:type I restriction enzyme R subunit